MAESSWSSGAFGAPFIRRWAAGVSEALGLSVSVGESASTESELRALAEEAGVSDHDLARVLARLLGSPFVEALSDVPHHAEFVRQVPIQMARRFTAIALATSDGIVPVVVNGGEGVAFAEVVGRLLHCPVVLRIAPASVISAAINRAYQEQGGRADVLIELLEDSPELQSLRSRVRGEDLLDVAGRAPVIQLVNMLLFDAIRCGASDVHIQPYEESLVVRFRVDGSLFDEFTIPKGTQDELVSRVKVLGRMNIAEKRLPQDGRATVQVGDRQVDLRIASLPTNLGERVVIRLLEKTCRLYSLEELGMPERMLTTFLRLIHQEHGLLLVTGPTGAGKSTTLYASLQQVDSKNRNVLTIEDPIEYQLEGISQTQVSPKKGLTFASGLRSILRQDPDIIMVGEIRDRETAEMAVQSSLTGHFVFSTLHTNDAASAVTRMLDLGIEPYLVASSLTGVLAQRLVRRVCPDCRDARPVDPALWDEIGGESAEPRPASMFYGRGCSGCRHTGYRGRIGLYELMVCSERIRNLIQRAADAAAIRRAAVEEGMSLLSHDGLSKVMAGTTTLDEVIRISALEGDAAAPR